jgi:hypothetical protein
MAVELEVGSKPAPFDKSNSKVCGTQDRSSTRLPATSPINAVEF